MTNQVFLPDIETTKEPIIVEGGAIKEPAGIIGKEVSEEALKRGAEFSKQIEERMISDFKKPGDLMVHVSSYAFVDGVIYVTYYANTDTEKEDPSHQKSRLVYCPADDVDTKTYIDLQCAGDMFHGKKVDCLYDTILMHKDDGILYLMWTAAIEGNYYRLYRTFDTRTGALGEIEINRLKVRDSLCDFSITGMKSAFAEHEIGYKNMYSDIGIMQKTTTRVEDGKTYYYSGAYCGDCNFIIKSLDFVTWEYVATPDFINLSKWENATYVIGDKCYYFLRQGETEYGFLTCYDLVKETWDKPVLVYDCQSRSDFIMMYDGSLCLFHAPCDREHIGCIRINRDELAKSEVIFRAKMHESCFYPFIQYGDGGMYFSYTSARKHIRLSRFDEEICIMK